MKTKKSKSRTPRPARASRRARPTAKKSAVSGVTEALARKRLSLCLGALERDTELTALAAAACGVRPGAGLPELRVEVALVSEGEIRRANAEFRKKDAVTDVLSFPGIGALRVAGYLGEIAICTQQLQRQARAQGHTAARELDVLLVHGLLHLLGLDHERSAAEASRMADGEARLLVALSSRAPSLITRAGARTKEQKGSASL